MIDPHVHLRDWDQHPKETLKHGFSVAQQAGIRALFEMPNTQPVLTSRERIVQRIQDADAAIATLDSPCFHGIYGGVTQDMQQVQEMVAVWKDLFPRVVGLKYFAGHSTGNMGLVDPKVQQNLFNTLANAGYTGVLAIHCEDESLLRPERWNPKQPETHSLARPGVAEIVSVSKQIEMADNAGFQGTLHICHLSTPKALYTVERWRESGVSCSITTGATPHHLLLWNTLQIGTAHNELKMNPPLRSKADQEELLELFLSGRIDWLESDHAPHTLQDKDQGASGIPGFLGYRLLVEHAKRRGLSKKALQQRTANRVIEVFGLEKEPAFVASYYPNTEAGANRELPSLTHKLPPLTQELYQKLASAYPFQSFRAVVPETWQ